MLIEENFMDMTIGTLAHELAHGFHHAAADKDGLPDQAVVIRK